MRNTLKQATKNYPRLIANVCKCVFLHCIDDHQSNLAEVFAVYDAGYGHTRAFRQSFFLRPTGTFPIPPLPLQLVNRHCATYSRMSDDFKVGMMVRVIGGELKDKQAKLEGKQGKVVKANGKGNTCTVDINGTEHKLLQTNLSVVSSRPNNDSDDDEGDDDEDENDDDDDDADDDAEVDDLVTRTLNKFITSKFQSKATACSSLRTSLMNAGKQSDKQLNNRGGVTSARQARSKDSNLIEEAQSRSTLYDTSSMLAPPLKPPKVIKPETVGKGWFDMKPMKVDEKLKRDIKIIQMRNYLDPKRFYKNPDKIGKVLHVGTVVEGPDEYLSSRLTGRERKQTIVEEILGDSQLKDYAKRKYNEIQFEKQNKKKMFKKRKKLRR